MRIRISALDAAAAGTDRVPCLGCSAEGRQGMCFVAATSSPRVGQEVEVEDQRVLPVPPGFVESEALAALRRWPARRVARAGRIELGSGVAVLGGGGFAEPVVEACRRFGCLWLERVGEAADADPARWPARPDVVVVLGAASGGLQRGLALVRDRGGVVLAGDSDQELDLYPDVHRRGLRIAALDPFDGGEAAAWLREAPRLRAGAGERAGRR